MTLGLVDALCSGTVTLTAAGKIIDGNNIDLNIHAKALNISATTLIGSDASGSTDALEITVCGGSATDIWVGNTGTGPVYAYFTTVGGKSPLSVGAEQGSGAMIFVDGQYEGGDPAYFSEFNTAKAFAEDTPELKSRQGVFGTPMFIHDQMDLNEPIAMGLVEYLLSQGYSIEGDVELPPRVTEDIEAMGLGPRNTIRFGAKADAEATTNKKQASTKESPAVFVALSSVK